MAYNMSWILWYNIWFAVMKISISFYSINNTPVNMEEFLDFNILLFIAFMVGNMISNSFLITIQRFILRFLISSSLFCLIMVASYFLINQVPPGEMFFQLKCLGLVLCIAIWHETIKKQKTIKYIEYYFS